MHTMTRLILAIALLSRMTSATAQDLMEVYALALKNDTTLSSAKYGNQAAQEKLVQGKALFKPTISLNSSANHSDTDIKYVGSDNVFRNAGRESFETYQYGVNINQPIFRKQIWAQYAQAKSQVAQADLQLLATQQDLMLRTSQAYFDVLLAQDNIDLIAAQKSAISQQRAQAKGNFDAGVATITDVYDTQAKYDLVVAQEIAAVNQLKVKQRALQTIIGKTPGRLATLDTTEEPQPPQPGTIEPWLQLAEQNNLAVTVQQQNLEIATQEVDKQNAGHMPMLDAVGSYTDSRSDNGINGFGTNLKNGTIGLQLQIPIYQGGAIDSKVREAVANKLKAQEDVETAKRKAEQDTSQAFWDTISSISQIRAYDQALISGQGQVDATTKGYQVGLRTTVDILNAQQQLFTAKRDLLQARYSYWINSMKLKAATGMLNNEDLIAINLKLNRSESALGR